MSVRRTRFALVFLVTLFLTAGFALAQPSFNPAGGLFGPGAPGVIDEDRNGPNAGDRLVYPTFAQPGVIQIQNSPCGSVFLPASSSGAACAGVLDEYDYNGMFMVDQFDMGAAVGGGFDDGNTQGGLEIQDLQGDGVFDQIVMTSTNSFFDNMVFGFQRQDTDGDGAADYVGVGGLSSVLPPCQDYDPDDPVWIPLAFTSPTTKSVVLDLGGDGIPDPQFLPGPTLVRLDVQIPTLGEWGLLLLVLSLVTLSLRILRVRA
jgi:hypothetical protein